MQGTGRRSRPSNVACATADGALPQVVLLGNADDVVQHLCRKLGWDLPEPVTSASGQLEAPRPNLKKRPSAEFEVEPRRVGERYVLLTAVVTASEADSSRWQPCVVV